MIDMILTGIAIKIGWAIGEIAVAIVIFAVIFGIYLLFQLPSLIRKKQCKHLKFRETSQCDAICSNCGKNLGFIGSWREKIQGNS